MLINCGSLEAGRPRVPRRHRRRVAVHQERGDEAVQGRGRPLPGGPQGYPPQRHAGAQPRGGAVHAAGGPGARLRARLRAVRREVLPEADAALQREGHPHVGRRAAGAGAQLPPLRLGDPTI